MSSLRSSNEAVPFRSYRTANPPRVSRSGWSDSPVSPKHSSTHRIQTASTASGVPPVQAARAAPAVARPRSTSMNPAADATTHAIIS
jgi:hypothetical protein